MDPPPLAPGTYRGRFAPSPTGALHFGSLVAAMASYLQARRHQGEWLLRVEDLDTPREVPGAAAAMLHTLEAFGLYWDGAVQYQSRHHAAYEAALEHLTRGGHIYPCGCSRREIADTGWDGADGVVYPGTCRNGLPPRRAERALRVRTDAAVIAFQDGLQGALRVDLERAVGDFVVRRADGPFAYQLAVVVDDAAAGITEVVRGSDLLYSTPRQIHLQHLLGLATPQYLHVPVATDLSGAKLSKSAGAGALDWEYPLAGLVRAAAFLGLEPPAEVETSDVATFWDWTIGHWDPARLPRLRVRAVDARGRVPR